jgi:hypothetical protein
MGDITLSFLERRTYAQAPLPQGYSQQAGMADVPIGADI